MRETVEKNRDRLKALLALKDEVKEIVAIRRKREEEERKKKEEEERKKKEEEEKVASPIRTSVALKKCRSWTSTGACCPTPRVTVPTWR